VSYHDLSECTLTDDERRAEASRICGMLEGYWTQMNDVENGFVSRMSEPNARVSVKQLFWLRDIKDKMIA
jgi:hypothetical protein